MKKDSRMIKLFAIIFAGFLLCGNLVVAQQDINNSGIEELFSIKVIDDVPYREGNSESWKLDLAIPDNPDNKLRPAIVIVHGGGWRAGSKQDLVYRSMLLNYAKQGYVTLSVEYRLDQEAAFPACIEDVKCAVRWLRAHAEDLNVNPEKIGAFGHSAGAHLVLMLAMSSGNADLEGDGGWEQYSSKINAVVGGSTPTQIGPQRANWNKPEWWPIGYISANTVPMLLIQGIEDPIVRVELVDDFVEKMKAAGAADLTYIRIEGGDHDVAYSDSLEITKPAMDDFFERTLKAN